MECFQFEMDPENRRLLRSPEIKKLVNREIKNAVSLHLTPKQRTTVYLYYGRKMRMEDVARTLKVNISTVSRSIKRARERIDRYMDEVMLRLREQEKN